MSCSHKLLDVQNAGLGRGLALAAVGAASTALYGAAMGCLRGELQPLYGAAKFPIFFLCTWAITFPACHVGALLLGERLAAGATAVLVLKAIAVTGIVLSGFAPVDLLLGASFDSSKPDYRLFQLVQVALLAGAAFTALAMLARDLAAARLRRPRLILVFWGLIYGFVGSQWVWTLRPWIGHPGLEVEFMRWGRVGPTAGMNFYTSCWWSIKTLFQ